jgi:hypothetical protein
MKPLFRPLIRAHEICREFGLKATIELAIKKAVSPAVYFGSVYIMQCDVGAGLPEVKAVPGIIAREAFLSDLHLLDGIENDTEKKHDALERFKRGDRWFVGIDSSNGKLTNFRWVTTAWELIPELQRNIVPKPGEAFVYALYTVPEYRRRGIDSFTRYHAYSQIHRDAGINTVLATIFSDNTVSQKAAKKFLTKLGRVWYFSIRGGPTHVFWWPNRKMPTLSPIAPAAQAAFLEKVAS